MIKTPKPLTSKELDKLKEEQGNLFVWQLASDMGVVVTRDEFWFIELIGCLREMEYISTLVAIGAHVNLLRYGFTQAC